MARNKTASGIALTKTRQRALHSVMLKMILSFAVILCTSTTILVVANGLLTSPPLPVQSPHLPTALTDGHQHNAHGNVADKVVVDVGVPHALLFEKSCKTVFTAGGGCRCVTRVRNTKCCCIGSQVRQIPQNFSAELAMIFFYNVGILEIREHDFSNYAKLEEIVIDNAAELRNVEGDAFRNLTNLRKLQISNCANLERWSGTLLRNNPKIQTLVAPNNALRTLPKMEMIPNAHQFLTMEIIDFSENRVECIDTGAFSDVATRELRLSRNALQHIAADAFRGSRFYKLALNENPELRNVSADAFNGIEQIHHLDMSSTAIHRLPVRGLKNVRRLTLQNVPTLKHLPPVLAFISLIRAEFTYPYHCCFFKYATREYEKGGQYREHYREIQHRACKRQQLTSSRRRRRRRTERSVSPTTSIRRKSSHAEESGASKLLRDMINWYHGLVGRTNANNNDDSGTNVKQQNTGMPTGKVVQGSGGVDNETATTGGYDNNSMNNGSLEQWVFDSIRSSALAGGFVVGPTTTDEEEDEEEDEDDDDEDGDDDDDEHPAYSGEELGRSVVLNQCVSSESAVHDFYTNISCMPQPDALNPCEDIVSYNALRVVIWVMWMGAIVGNIAVWVVIAAVWQRRMRLHYFFMLNVSFADFLTGVYLAILAVTDWRTANEYYSYAVEWQTGWGCSAAGFISVFASQLSIFSMLLIAVEIYYNAKYAFYGRRMSTKATCALMGVGYTYALGMAVLPLVGVSSYQHSSICLPLSINGPLDQAYLLLGLSLSALAFASMVVSYVLINCMIRNPEMPSRDEDRQILLRTIVLIGTDMICWLPTLFLGITAAMGWPLITLTNAKICLILFYPVNACANPLLYVFLTKIWQDAKRKAAPILEIISSRSHHYRHNHQHHSGRLSATHHHHYHRHNSSRHRKHRSDAFNAFYYDTLPSQGGRDQYSGHHKGEDRDNRRDNGTGASARRPSAISLKSSASSPLLYQRRQSDDSTASCSSAAIRGRTAAASSSAPEPPFSVPEMNQLESGQPRGSTDSSTISWSSTSGCSGTATSTTTTVSSCSAAIATAIPSDVNLIAVTAATQPLLPRCGAAGTALPPSQLEKRIITISVVSKDFSTSGNAPSPLSPPIGGGGGCRSRVSAVPEMSDISETSSNSCERLEFRHQQHHCQQQSSNSASSSSFWRRRSSKDSSNKSNGGGGSSGSDKSMAINIDKHGQQPQQQQQPVTSSLFTSLFSAKNNSNSANGGGDYDCASANNNTNNKMTPTITPGGPTNSNSNSNKKNVNGVGEYHSNSYPGAKEKRGSNTSSIGRDSGHGDSVTSMAAAASFLMRPSVVSMSWESPFQQQQLTTTANGKFYAAKGEGSSGVYVEQPRDVAVVNPD